RRWPVLGVPAHRRQDAMAAARVIIEDILFPGPRAHLSILAEMNGAAGHAVGLAAGVEPIEVGFGLLRADEAIEYGSGHEAEDGEEEHHQRQHRRVAEAADLPALPPARKREVEPQLQEAERGHRQHQEEE